MFYHGRWPRCATRPKARTLLWSLLCWMLLGLRAAGARSSTNPGSMSCDQLRHQQEAAELWVLGGAWHDDGPHHCNITCAFAATTHEGERAPLSWHLHLRVSREALQQELQLQQAQEPAHAPRTNAMDNIQLTTFLCMPRVVLLWGWLRDSSVRHAVANATRHALLLLQRQPAATADAAPTAAGAHRPEDHQAAPMGGEAAAAAAAVAAAAPAPPHGVDAQLAVLRQLQRALQREPDTTHAAQPGQPSKVKAGAWPSLPTPWSFATWAAVALCPGLLVAQWAIAACSEQPGCVLCLCAFGMLRTGFEAYALHQALSNQRLRFADKMDSLICSHLLPTALTALFSGLQVLMEPLMPAPMSEAVSWLCLLLLPPICMWALLASWVPEEDAHEAAHGLRGVRRARHHSHHHSHGRGDAGGWPGGNGEGAGTGSGEHAAERKWPPALDVPPQIDELPPEEMPESFRCPITLAIMREPAQSTSGITFERSAIFQWLATHRHDPVTHAPLRRRHVSPNLCLRQLMEAWIADKAVQLRLQEQLEVMPLDKKDS